jgi:predicted flap endonuclease-1-like 5' DNA nuclease
LSDVGIAGKAAEELHAQGVYNLGALSGWQGKLTALPGVGPVTAQKIAEGLNGYATEE